MRNVRLAPEDCQFGLPSPWPLFLALSDFYLRLYFPFPSSYVMFAVAGGIRSCPSIKLFSSAGWAAIQKRAIPAAARPSQIFPWPRMSLQRQERRTPETHRVAQ